MRPKEIIKEEKSNMKSLLRKGKYVKRLLGLILAFTMMFSMVASVPGLNSVLADSGNVSVKSSDLVQVKVGDTVETMNLYMNGVYEAAVEVASGIETALLLVNGEETDIKVAVSEGEEVLRLVDGTLQVATVPTAALVGNFYGIEFVDGAGDRYDIASWTPADENAELEYVGGGIYKRTFTFNELEEDLTLADSGYKVAFNDSWDYSFGEGDANIPLTIPAGTSSLTIFVDEINRQVYDSVRSKEFETIHNDGNVSRPAFDTTISLIGPVRGGNSDWDASVTGYEFEQISEKVFRYQEDFAAGTYEYKCVFNYSGWYEAESGNRSFTLEEDGHVVFLYDTDTKKLYDTVNNFDTVQSLLNMKESEGSEEQLTVHFLKPTGWEDSVNVYAWLEEGTELTELFGGWPGKAISKNSEHAGWYDAVIEGYVDSVVNFIFNDGSNQTENLSNKNYKGLDELWVIGNEVTKEESWNVESTESLTLKITDCVEVKIDDTMYEMDLYTNGTYEVEVPVAGDAELYINGEATGSSVSVTANAILRVKNGVLSVATVPTAALVGNFYGIEFVDGAGDRYDIASWTPADENAELEYVGGGIYKRTFTFNELEEDLTLADSGYKVAFNDSWDYSFGEGDANIPLTIPAGTSSLTIFVDEINRQVYDSVRSKSFEVVQNSGNIQKPVLDTTISLIGTIRGNDNTNWSAGEKGWEFTQISENLYRYQGEFAEGSYQYKCVFDYNNWYEAEDNKALNLEEETHVVFLYDSKTGLLYDSVNNASTVAQFLGMEAEPVVMKVVDNANGTTRFVALEESTLYYGKKADVEENGTDALTKVEIKENEGKFESEDIFLGDEALDIVYYYEINGVRTLDTSNQTVTVNDAEYSNYTREAFTGRLVCVPGTFPGPSWDAASNEMTYEGNGLYSYTFEDVPAANYEYKIAMGAWGENYGANGTPDGSNIAVAVPSQQDVTIWYNDFTHNSVNSIEYVFADITLEGTGIPEGTKLTDDGLTGIYSVTVSLTAGTYSDLKIIYDGKEYEITEFTLEADKDVTFYMDPSTGLYYHNGSDVPVETDAIVYDSQDETYKSVFGAVATNEEVTFSIKTGADVTSAVLVVKGVGSYGMEATENEDGTQTYSAAVSFTNIGEYDYYFAISNGSSVVVYGDDDGCYGEGVVTDLTEVQPYDLIVYQEGYETPDWMKNAVIYQIFPDRFYDGDESNNDDQTHARGAVDYEYIADWYTLPENPEQEALLDEATYKATGAYYGDGEWSNEIYGGDLQGIIEKIDYLKALGVNVIYLNPVFASISNHRYDTSDYTEIDPILGTEGDFAELVRVAEANDMHIILDGVFNHVSDDSIYFDRYYRYLGTSEKIGTYPYWAYVYDLVNEEGYEQADAEAAAKAYFTEEYGITDYSYTEWVTVENEFMTDGNGNVTKDSVGLRAGKDVYTYEGWWGYDSMPVIKSTNGSEYQTGNWAEEIIDNEDKTSVTQYWISKGNDGWRLDVANEVSDETWQKFRESVKALDSDAVIIGEIWDDATKYLKGDMYDSVMNYLFRNAVTSFAMGTNAEDTTKAMEKIRERYPEEAFYAMMNLVGSHDTTRVLSYLDGIGDDRSDTSLAAAFPTWESTSVLAKDRQKLVAFLQFTYAGAPTIYYGDEIGMVGSDDPDDRRAFEWGQGDQETVEWYATLAAIRAEYSALRTGSVEVFDVDADVMGYVRRDDANALVVVANNASESKQVVLNMSALAVKGETFKDLVTGTTYTVGTAGTITVDVDALRGAILVEPSAAVTIEVGSALAEAYDSAYIVAEREAVPPTDAEALTAAITKAEALVADNYTEESWAAVEAALEAAKAVAENEAATQDEIDEATAALNDAMDALVAVEPIVVDKSALSAAIQEAEALKADDYTEESWAAVEEALADAKEVYDNAEATQEEVDAATAALNDAMDALAKPAETVKPTWKSWLDKIFGGWFDDDDDTDEPDQPVEPDQPENPDQPDEPVEPEEPSKPSWGGMFDWIFSWWK